MKEFMAYVQNAFYDATGWNRDNNYSTLNSTGDDLLRFRTPQGLRLTFSSLATPQFATSYQLGSVGVVDGSISYLYSSIPLRAHLTPQSDTLHLPWLCRAYQALRPLPRRHPVESLRPIPDNAPSLLYGRLYLPRSLLEALAVKRFSPALQFQVRAVSSPTVKNGGSLLALAQYDVGRYAVEGLAASDGGVLGVRGVYNFGGDASEGEGEGSSAPPSDRERIYGRFSAGGEVYYGTLNKSGGASCGLRFATLPEYSGTPLAAVVTLNPLMGSISASYAVQAGRFLSLGSRLDFNVYSYESNWSVGMELWRKEFLRRVETEKPSVELGRRERSFQAKMEWRLDEPETIKPDPAPVAQSEDEYGGTIKMRFDQNTKLGLLWEGRVKSLLFSVGTNIDLQRIGQPFRTLGLELQYSS